MNHKREKPEVFDDTKRNLDIKRRVNEREQAKQSKTKQNKAKQSKAKSTSESRMKEINSQTESKSFQSCLRW
jgi:hypothetical protein